MRQKLSYLEFQKQLLGFRLYDKSTLRFVSKHIPFHDGLSIKKIKEKYILKARKKDDEIIDKLHSGFHK